MMSEASVQKYMYAEINVAGNQDNDKIWMGRGGGESCRH
jgi:hypothetical protein